eukprot:1143597-Pelagomonas_calceolata.AAC.2
MPSYLVTFLSVPRPNLATQCHFALESFAQMGMFLFDFALDLLLFVATTIALLASTTDPLQRLLHMLPIGARNQVVLFEIARLNDVLNSFVLEHEIAGLNVEPYPRRIPSLAFWRLFGKAPFMGPEPLGLPGRVHTCRPGPPPTLKLWLASQTKLLGSPAVSGGGAAAAMGGSSSWPASANLPSALKISMLAEQPCYRGSQFLVTWGAAGKIWEQRFHKVLVLTFPGRPLQAPGTAPVDFFSILLLMPSLIRGLGCPLLGLCSQSADLSSLHNFKCDGVFNSCPNDGVSCCVNREVKAQKFADAMRSMSCTPCPGVWMREPLVYGLLLVV